MDATEPDATAGSKRPISPSNVEHEPSAVRKKTEATSSPMALAYEEPPSTSEANLGQPSGVCARARARA